MQFVSSGDFILIIVEMMMSELKLPVSSMSGEACSLLPTWPLVSAFCREDGCYILLCSMKRGSRKVKVFCHTSKGVAFIGPYSSSQERNPHDLITSFFVVV